jgi:hypothetical protein
MSDETPDAEYDLAPIQKPVRPVPQPKPPTVLAYQRAEPLQPVQADVPPAPKNVLSASEKAGHWLKYLGSTAIILIGVALTRYFSMWIGFTVVGLGIAYLMISGPSDSEKRGYHF